MLRKFEYFKPQTLKEACSLLTTYGKDAKILAGGTDLIVMMRYGLVRPRYIIDVKGIRGLNGLEYNGGKLRIGALTPLSAVETSPLIKKRFDILREAAASMGGVQTRNRGTVGGNLCNASPACDMAPPLIALGARARIQGPRSSKVLPLEDFFISPGKTILKHNELLTEVSLPTPPPRSAGAFFKFGKRNAMEISIVNGAVSLTLGKDGCCQRATICLGSVAPTPLRVKKAERVLKRKAPVEDKIREAAEVASTEIRPITDIRGSAEYRRELTKVLVRRALAHTLGKIKER